MNFLNWHLYILSDSYELKFKTIKEIVIDLYNNILIQVKFKIELNRVKLKIWNQIKEMI